MYRKGVYVEQDQEKAMQYLMLSRKWGEPAMDFRNCEIDDGIVSNIASRLQDDKATLKLYLSNNLIGDAGAAQLASMLARNVVLEILDLQSNPIGYYGLRAIAQAMRGNTTLQKVLFTLPTLVNVRVVTEGQLIQNECETNERIAALLRQQESWKAGLGWNGLPLDLLALLEQSLIRSGIKLHGIDAEESMRRVQEMQLCLSNFLV
jgi:hypothetical protein